MKSPIRVYFIRVRPETFLLLARLVSWAFWLCFPTESTYALVETSVVQVFLRLFVLNEPSTAETVTNILSGWVPGKQKHSVTQLNGLRYFVWTRVPSCAMAMM
ncbi:hypothetical protein RvY_05277 [Ramazzottius varieornatus]|uniref:Uncharacterized protein n=1 Tax=Ramazzottius varieornatus TaxID=947166 RepID=A0A1D1UUG5_RAMVA|nr:hypothetical protein RvY_05277 [Ramazzottius varieornatus]